MPTPSEDDPAVPPATWPHGRRPFEVAPPLAIPAGTPTTLTARQEAALRADLAERGVDVTDFRVLAAVAVTWPDGSWGCPQPGTAYVQALEDGLRVLVEVAGRAWDYRCGRRGTFRLCRTPQGPLPR